MGTKSEREEIEKIAYEIWQAEGEPEGRDQEHWERARKLFESRRPSAADRDVDRDDKPKLSTYPVGEHHAVREVPRDGPRNPEPLHPTNAEGYVAVPSDKDAVPGAVGDDPRSSRASSKRSGSKSPGER